MSDTSATLWREAFSTFERLLEMCEADRREELTRLSQTRPELHEHVVKMLDADGRADVRTVAGGLLSSLAAEVGAGARRRGSTLGPYALERELGAGGMGEVWLVRRKDGVSDALVALKLLHGHLGAGSVRERFSREGRLLGQLTHPNIARLLDAGVAPSGELYLAIEYIDGLPLDRWCDDHRLDAAARVKLFLQVCDAVAHAHARLIVHRDLKPSNIMVTPDGVVKLLDFGIAKLVETTQGGAQQTELTRIGGRVLTPEYAAPEQILSQPVSVATDVYSLGVILYQLLCGRRPYGASGMSLLQLEREVLETEPMTLSRAARGIGDLDVIVGKALKKKPEERYASVPALADDLRRYLANEPVLAKPDSLAYRTHKYLRRHRVGVTIVAMLAIALAISSKLYLDANAATIQAEKESAQAKALSDFLQWDVLQSINSGDKDTGKLVALKALLDAGAAKINDRLKDQPVAAAKLRNSFLMAYSQLGFFAEQAKLQKDNTELAKRLLDADSPDALEVGLAKITGNGAPFDENSGDYQMKLDRLALATWAADDVRLLSTRIETGRMLEYRGDPEGARAVFEALMTGLKTADPRSDDYKFVRAWAILQYMDFHRWAGENPEAEALVLKMLDEERQAPGTYRDDTLVAAREKLASLYVDLGRLDDAQRVFDTFYKAASTDRAQGDYGVMNSSADLAWLRCAQGRNAEAITILDSISAQFSAADDDDWVRMDMEEGTGHLYELAGNLPKAETVLRHVIAQRTKHVPAASLMLARDHLGLANVLREQGRVADAREQMDLIPQAAIAKLRATPTDRNELLRAQGLLALAEGHRDEAIAKLGEAAPLSEKIYTDKSFFTIRLRKELAAAQALQT